MIKRAKRTNLLALFVLGNLSLYSQCTIDYLPFKDGEQINYDIFYNLKNIWVSAGKVRFSVSDSIYNNKECFHFDGKGKTLKNYDWFFKVRDHYASLATKNTLTPLRFVRDVNEGGYLTYYDYRFNHIDNTAKVYLNKKDSTKSQNIKIQPCAFDVMTAVYYARCLDFSDLKVGDTIPFTFIVDKELFNVHIRYTGKSVIKTLDNKRYRCIKFKPLLIEGTLFEEGEFMEVFVTDDKNRIPLYIEAKILVGTVKAYITSFKNVKYPLDSKLN